MSLPSYVLITPARNEAEFIELTIKSMVAQQARPAKWIIVSDGSTDGTDEIVQKYVDVHPWIELVRMPERRERHFAAKVNAFNAGYARMRGLKYDVIGNLDGDLSFDEDYFSFLLSKLVEDSTLGLVGTPFKEFDSGQSYDYRIVSIEHVSGACQLFRRECFEAIGGYVPLKSGGIDLVAVLRARLQGWQTRTFTDKTCLHHRKMGAAQITGFRERLHRGRMDYLLGSHPAWEVFRSIYQMKHKPYVIGGILILASYVWNVLRREKRTIPEDLIELRRSDQMQRLRGVFLRTLRRIVALG
jgi:poly-beta-1,6-N-acetyl-D-glucosamine synthase